MNNTQMNKFLDEIVEKFNGQEFTIDDIKNLDTFAEPKKIKKKKDPNAPKKASTAWIFYTTETRIKLRDENPDKKMTELTTIMSEMWRNLSDEDKEPYRILEGNDRKRYKLEKMNMTAILTLILILILTVIQKETKILMHLREH